MKQRLYTILALCMCPFMVKAVSADSAGRVLGQYIQAAINYSENIPQEKVYLHFDNTSYYQGDNIWFKCYLVDAATNTASRLSRTLYVELLNPGGKVIQRRVLKVEDGQCHGDFSLGHLPFYSGYYEIRAYTKYMLNFGESAVFSRVFPVFDAPAKKGAYAERRMMRAQYGSVRYGSERPSPRKGKKLNARFYPEGGNIVAGLPVRVAFEVCDNKGFAVECDGRVVDESDSVVAKFSTLHEGKGVFGITVGEDARYKVILGYDGREYDFDMPEIRKSGVALSVDNTSSDDLVTIRLMKNPASPQVLLGVALSCRGVVYSYGGVLLDSVLELRECRQKAPSGVSLATVFDMNGDVVADRMFFVDNKDYGRIEVVQDKAEYLAGEKVRMTLTATKADSAARSFPISVSVSDGDNAVDYKSNMLSDLLLMSEIKGYVSNPSQYFLGEEDSADRLDLLMMVQGWRRYPWRQMAGIEPVDIRYLPEQGIELSGRVVSFVKSVPKPDVTVSAMMTENEPSDSLRRSFMDSFMTDSCGRFSFRCDVDGRWHLVMSVSEKGKKKDHRIILDRLFSPKPKAIEYTEQRFDIALAGTSGSAGSLDDSLEEYGESEDTITGHEVIGSKAIMLKEVEVKSKRHSREADVFKNRAKSVAYYDAKSELDKISDEGDYIGQDLFGMLLKINPHFFKRFSASGEEEILYKGGKPLFVIDYKPSNLEDSVNYRSLYLESIKSIYINEELQAKCKYADVRLSPLQVDKRYGCVVFIETDPAKPAPPGKGTRRTMIEGYSVPAEFYHPDYSKMPEEEDYRRTLYWNPYVLTDEHGKVSIEFYNNSTCRKMKVSAQGIGYDGTVYDSKLK